MIAEVWKKISPPGRDPKDGQDVATICRLGNFGIGQSLAGALSSRVKTEQFDTEIASVSRIGRVKMAGDTFELRLTGHNAVPERLDVADVYALLKAYRDVLVMICPPDPEAMPAGPAVALLGIKKGSAKFQIRVARRLHPAVSTVSRAVIHEDFEELPAAARRALRSMVNDLKDAGQSLALPPYRRKPAVLGGGTTVPVNETESYTGRTTLYGRVQLTGGGRTQETGRAELILGDGTVVRVTGDRTLIKQLGSNLYDEVGIDGIVRWDALTNVPHHIVADRVQVFPAGDVGQAFDRLAKAAGDHWDSIDAAEYVHSLRSDEE
jgi:hypothetical protein